jgi:hypothetical protein
VKRRSERIVLVAGMALATANIWTGAPLLGLWVGSRVAPSSGISMLAVFAVAATIFGVAWALIRILATLSARYDEASGRRRTVRRHVPWLRSMRGERPNDTAGESALSAGDYVVVVGVVLCLLAFEYWFFFLSGSSIDQRSGR